ncbi:hypothetical protein QZM15_27835 [Burkholderia sp. AU44665]|uniref:hypothetical protein n=1 Tax=Burkholderia sp. AU44665 TaxID=3059203 RepID=UPI0026603D0E|nr:hypothetical protein [Burkholderia sp. AU44665]MDN7702293.1 hypothetical protein [Burkholderia sp. AU44665]
MSLTAFNPHRGWDGKKETLIDAAKAATSAPVSPVEPAAHPVSPRTGRVHVPSLSESLCVRHKLATKEPLYATQTQGRSDD